MNNPAVYTTVISKNKKTGERGQNDYYATDPESVKALLQLEKFNHYIWEPACGEGHISKVLESAGYDVLSTDLIYRDFGDERPFNFLDTNEEIEDDIVTNPPYSLSTEFVYKALEILRPGGKCAMLLKIQFLEGKARAELFKKYPPKVIYVFSERQVCAKNGRFEDIRGSAVCYAWFIWEKGFKGDPIVKWIN